ncbi:MAG: tail fiber protein [Acidobacteriota bacterium]
MSTPYLSQITLYAFGFAPKGWMLCNGQLLSISQNAALFSLLGTTYGGNGTSTFALPNLQSCTPIGFSGNYPQGYVGGEVNHTLITSELPLHYHTPSGSSLTGTQTSPVNAFPAANAGNPYVASTSSPISMTPSTAGGNQPHSNQSPSLVLNFCIATVGIFPSRN